MNLFAYYAPYLSIIIRIISAAFLLFLLIPLQIKEATVKNGLRKLRILLLAIGLSLFSLNLLSIFLIYFTTQDKDFPIPFNSLIQFVDSVLFLSISIILYFIYHSQYTPEAKEVHKQVDKAEKKAKYKADLKNFNDLTHKRTDNKKVL